MEANLMSPTQLRALANELEQKDKIVATAQLHYDLHLVDWKKCNFEPMDEWVTWGKIEKQLEIIENYCFTNLVMPTGTRFVAYYYDGARQWFDDENFGVEEQTDEWAILHLTDIKYVK